MPTRSQPDDDVVVLPDVDLDAESEPGRDDEPVPSHQDPDDHARPSTRWRWLPFLAVFLAGGLLGAYLSNLDGQAETATVTAQFDAVDVVPNHPRDFVADEPVRVDIEILNTSDREIVVDGVAVPGLVDDDDGGLLKPRTIAARERSTVTVVNPVDCAAARDLPPVMMLEVTTSDGQQHQIEATGPQTSAFAFERTLQYMCSTSSGGVS